MGTQGSSPADDTPSPDRPNSDPPPGEHAPAEGADVPHRPDEPGPGQDSHDDQHGTHESSADQHGTDQEGSDHDAREPDGEDQRGERPSEGRKTPTYATGRSGVPGVVPPPRPPDPILPFIAPPLPRKRRRDWAILVFALVASSLIMAGCCIAGFAIYNGYGS